MNMKAEGLGPFLQMMIDPEGKGMSEDDKAFVDGVVQRVAEGVANLPKMPQPQQKAFSFYTGQEVSLSYYSDDGSAAPGGEGSTITTRYAVFLRVECHVNTDYPPDEAYDLRFVFQFDPDYWEDDSDPFLVLDYAAIVRVEDAPR